MPVDELRLRVAAALRSAVDAHNRGVFEDIAPLYDRLAAEASALQSSNPDVMAAIHFLDSWYDSSNHDWQYYEQMGAADWPRVGAQLAHDLESGSPIDPAVREQFTFVPRTGTGGWFKSFFKG